MHDGIGATEHLVGLAELGQVDVPVFAHRMRIGHEVRVAYPVTVLEQLPDDRAAGLAAPAGDDDAHYWAFKGWAMHSTARGQTMADTSERVRSSS